jgi:hypothetical protein
MVNRSPTYDTSHADKQLRTAGNVRTRELPADDTEATVKQALIVQAEMMSDHFGRAVHAR